MKLYEKYLLKLFLSRFFVIVFCTSIFGIFQEMMKSTTMVACTFLQALTIVPLWLPLILFNFFPFILFGTLLLVLTEIYRSNELVSYKTIGISNKKMLKILLTFGLIVGCFSALLSLSYPLATRFFFQKQSEFNATNLLKLLQPNKVNSFGKYHIFFTNIDKNDAIHNITIVANDNNVSANKRNKKVIFAKKIALGFNDYGEIIGRCEDVNIFTLGFGANDNTLFNNNTMEREQILSAGNNETVKQDKLIKSVVIAKRADVLFDDFFKQDRALVGGLNYKNRLRQMDFMSLIKLNTNNAYEASIKTNEIQSRVYIHWFVVLDLVCIFSLLLMRTSNRSGSNNCLLLVVFFGAYIALNKAFVLLPVIERHGLVMYYLHFVVLAILFVAFFLKSDKKHKRKQLIAD